MTLYLQNQQTSVTWPEPFESTWQLLGGPCAHDLAPKLPHLGMADILFITTIMSLPRQQRPWGIATWMSGIFALSRPALYELTKRVKQRLLPTTESFAIPAPEKQASSVTVTPTRIARTVLTASLPGKMAMRPLRHALNEAFDQTRSIGWISELLTAAGDKAGRVLGAMDTTPLGTVIAARDETFFQGSHLLLVMRTGQHNHTVCTSNRRPQSRYMGSGIAYRSGTGRNHRWFGRRYRSHVWQISARGRT